MDSIKELLEKANNGDAKAQYSLGEMYQKGNEVSQDYEKAIFWYTKAAEQGDLNSELLLDLFRNEKDRINNRGRKDSLYQDVLALCKKKNSYTIFIYTTAF